MIGSIPCLFLIVGPFVDDLDKMLISRFMPGEDEPGEVGEIPVSVPRASRVRPSR